MLKGKDRGKLGSNVMSCKTRHAAKQRKQTRLQVSARSIIALLIAKGHPLISLVLNIARK
jgi:hypothetical protein